MARFPYWLVAAIMIGASGNSPAQPATSPTNSSLARQAPTNPPAKSSQSVSRSYILSANDLIRVEVFQEEDLHAERKIAADGTIIFPLIGTVLVAGKSVEAAAEVIRTRLQRDYLVNPRVSVTVLEPVKKRFTVLGEVQRAGVVEFTGEHTISLVEAIAMAGGPNPKGNLSRVTVLRANGEVFRDLDVSAMAKNPKSPSFLIQPNDTVTVSQRLF